MHIEIEKITERSNDIRVPGQYEADGKTLRIIKDKVLEIFTETINTENIKSYRHWIKSNKPEWKKIKGDVTVLYMSGEERRDSLGNITHCTILINESYNSFCERMGIAMVRVGEQNKREREFEPEQKETGSAV